MSFPEEMKRVVAMATRLARESEDISSRSGVSVRATIANFELVEASALQRALRNGEASAAPRVSDLAACVEPMIGKLEFEHFGSRTDAAIVRELFGAAIHRVFTSSVTEEQLAPIEAAFSSGFAIDVSIHTRSNDIVGRMTSIDGLAIPEQYQSDPSLAASWCELVLEGLVQHRVIERVELGDVSRFAGSGA
jgi:magnesium chelatase subunit I